VDAGLVRRLRGAGHDVFYVPEFASGMTDAEVLRRAYDKHRLLFTEDKDFGELVFRLHMPVPGLVLLCIDPEGHLLKWVPSGLRGAEIRTEVFGRYAVIEEARFRSRPLLGSTQRSRERDR
jgi:hypothetical protein